MELGRSGGVRGERTEHTQLFSRTLAGSGLTGRQKVHVSTFDGKLELQCARNGSQNLPFCPGSLQDTFIIYSSISHQHIFQKHAARKQKLENPKSQITTFALLGCVTSTVEVALPKCHLRLRPATKTALDSE